MVRLALLLCFAAVPLRAQEVLAVLSSDLASYRQAHAGFTAAYGPGAGARSLADGGFSVPPETRVVVAFGRKAAERAYPSRVKIVACLAPGLPAGWAGRRPAVKIDMLPPAEKLLAALKGIHPGLKRLTVIWSAAAYEGYVERLHQASGGHALAIRSERLGGVEGLPAALRGLVGETDALWLLPDPNILTAQSFAMIESFGHASRLPVFAAVPGLAEKGAAAAVFVPFGESGRAAAEAARELLKDGASQRHILPEKIETALNLTAARKYGLTIPPDAISRADLVLP